MATRTRKQPTQAPVEAPASNQQLFWLPRAEIANIAESAVNNGLSEEEAFSLFDQDAQGFHLDGMRLNAGTFKYQYHQFSRAKAMAERIKSAKIARTTTGA